MIPSVSFSLPRVCPCGKHAHTYMEFQVSVKIMCSSVQIYTDEVGSFLKVLTSVTVGRSTEGGLQWMVYTHPPGRDRLGTCPYCQITLLHFSWLLNSVSLLLTLPHQKHTLGGDFKKPKLCLMKKRKPEDSRQPGSDTPP